MIFLRWITAETPEYTWSQHLLTLACAASHNQPWKCYAVVDIHQILSNGEISGSWNQVCTSCYVLSFRLIDHYDCPKIPIFFLLICFRFFERTTNIFFTSFQRKFRASDCCHKRKFGTNQPFVRDSVSDSHFSQIFSGLVVSTRLR